MSDRQPLQDTAIDPGLAHDIRSPMNAVLGLCDLLAKSEPLTDRQREFIRALQTSTGALMDQVNRLLESHGYIPADMSRPEPELPHAPPPDDTRPNVLLVDDYAPNALVVATYLEKFGYDYDVADNGVEAVTLARRNRYIACLMDVQMHGMDGLECTGCIRDLEAAGETPGGARNTIIGVTAHALAGDRERCLAAGMDDYISKPVLPGILAQKLNAITARQPA